MIIDHPHSSLELPTTQSRLEDSDIFIIKRLSKNITIISVHPLQIMAVDGAVDDFGFRLQLMQQVAPAGSIRVGGGFSASLWHFQHHKFRVTAPFACQGSLQLTCKMLQICEREASLVCWLSMVSMIAIARHSSGLTFFPMDKAKVGYVCKQSTDCFF